VAALVDVPSGGVTVKIVVKHNGQKSEHNLPDQSFTVVVPPSGVKIESPTAYTIDSELTIKCMREMSQHAWLHISTGPLFPHFFNELFKDHHVALPPDISTLLEDYDDGVIHACGLIILLCEAMFEGRKEVYLKNPENHLHPCCQLMLVDVIRKIQSLYPGPDTRELAVL
jgi:hypothetical protein